MHLNAIDLLIWRIGPETLHVVGACGALARARVLFSVRSLRGNEGVWLQPSNAIVTAFARKAMDLVFLDANGMVLRVVPDVRPWRGAIESDARSVLKLAAGRARQLGLMRGTLLPPPLVSVA